MASSPHQGAHGPPLPGLLILLSVTTGLIDAVSVLGLAKTFSANMTGNIVFLVSVLPGRRGSVSSRTLSRWQPSLAVLDCRADGPCLWQKAAQALVDGRRHRRDRAPVGGGGDRARLRSAGSSPRWALFAIIGLTAVAMGFRNATIRQLKVPDLTTTVLTLTITGIAADSSLAGGSNLNLARRIAAVVAILLGAALGAWMVVTCGLALPLRLRAGGPAGHDRLRSSSRSRLAKAGLNVSHPPPNSAVSSRTENCGSGWAGPYKVERSVTPCPRIHIPEPDPQDFGPGSQGETKTGGTVPARLGHSQCI
jgi:hypothetical protein